MYKYLQVHCHHFESAVIIREPPFNDYFWISMIIKRVRWPRRSVTSALLRCCISDIGAYIINEAGRLVIQQPINTQWSEHGGSVSTLR